MTSIITFFGALFFVNKEISGPIQLVVFIVIVLVNLWFLLLWFYCLLSTIKTKWIQKFSSFLSRIVVSKELKFKEIDYLISKENNLKSFE